VNKNTRKMLLAVASTSLLVGSMGSAASAQDDPVRVGFSVYDMQYEFFQSMEQGTRDAAEARGWEFRLHDEKSDENEMVTGATAMLDDIDVLIISPFRPDALGPIIAAAKQKGVPVIVDDIGGGGTPYDAIVISDNAGGGVLAAEFMDEQIQALGSRSNKVVSIGCQPDAVYAERRNAAFEETITAAGYDVVTDLFGDSQADKAYTIMKDALAKDPDIAGVFACNDPMGVGAGNAIKDSGLDPTTDIVTVGFNADPEAITAIQSGGLSATVAQDPYGMGSLTVDLAEQVLAGDTPEFSAADEREVYMPVVLVTSDNVADFAE